MKQLSLLIILCAALLPSSLSLQAQTRYAGGDISMLPAYEEAGAVYKDFNGGTIENLLPWLKLQGMNAMRVRVFVNPEAYRQRHEDDKDNDLKYDPVASQTIENVLPLCQQIKEAGLDLMLDFHYSDTWADPAKQWTPIDWEDLNDDALVEKVYEYTRESLEYLRENGVTPAFIQTGNEISYGMMWGKPGSNNIKKVFVNSSANWQRFADLLNSAGRACREICPDAKIVIHSERTPSPSTLKSFYSKLDNLGVSYDVIGLSYYPYFHGDLKTLGNALNTLASQFPGKETMIVETGYPYKWAVPGSNLDFSNTWAYSEAGQAAFARDLVALLEQYPTVDGLFWWWLEYNAYGTSLSNWYNAPLFNSLTGRATPALKEICSFASTSGVHMIPDSDNGISDTDPAEILWFTPSGCPVANPQAPGLYISSKGKKIIP